MFLLVVVFSSRLWAFYAKRFLCKSKDKAAVLSDYAVHICYMLNNNNNKYPFKFVCMCVCVCVCALII